MTFSDQIRWAIRNHPNSLCELCRRCEVDQPSLVHFLNGDHTLKLNTLDRLADALGIQLVFGEPIEYPHAKRGRPRKVR